MKTIFTTLFLLAGLISYSQNPTSYLADASVSYVTYDMSSNGNINPVMTDSADYANCVYGAYATQTKDTLFVQNDSLGLQIKSVWDNDHNYVGKKPIIVVVQNLPAVVTAHKTEAIKPKKKKNKLKHKYDLNK